MTSFFNFNETSPYRIQESGARIQNRIQVFVPFWILTSGFFILEYYSSIGGAEIE